MADGSLVDLVVELSEEVTASELNETVRAEAAGRFSGIVQYTEAPVVSSDIIGNPHSSVFDAGGTEVLGSNLVKVLAWYDNEWGYSNRGGRPYRALGKTGRLTRRTGGLRRWSASLETKSSNWERFLTSYTSVQYAPILAIRESPVFQYARGSGFSQ